KAYRSRIDADFLGERGPHEPRGIARRIADFMAGEALGTFYARRLEPVEALWTIGVNDHHRLEPGPFAHSLKRGGEIGYPELGAARTHALGRQRRALSGFDVQIDAGILVPALCFGIIERRMVG